MKKTTAPLFTILLLASIWLISGCSSTKLVTSWSEENFTDKPIRKILIVGVMHNDMQTRVYEDQFVKRISSSGVTGIAAYTVIPSRKQYYDENEIKNAVLATGSDAALIARLVEVKTQERYVPPSYDYVPTFGYRRGFYDYYGMSHRAVYRPGYTTTDTIVELETTVFSTYSEKMIWAGSTQSLNPSSAKSVIEKNADLIIKDMKKSGLI